MRNLICIQRLALRSSWTHKKRKREREEISQIINFKLQAQEQAKATERERERERCKNTTSAHYQSLLHFHYYDKFNDSGIYATHLSYK